MNTTIFDKAANTVTNRDNLVLTRCAKHCVRLPEANAHLWRAGCLATTGSIPSLNFCSVRILLTDGVIAMFLLGDGETIFEGHLANWIEDEAEKEESTCPQGTQRQAIPRLSQKQLAALTED